MKTMLTGQEARNKILSGTQKIADIVKITLGPKGRNVIIDRPNAEPLITNDGVTIAREVELQCPYENMGSKALRQASIKTNEIAGDGTTGSMVLAAEIIKKANTHITLGCSPVLIKQGMSDAADFLVNYFSKTAKQVADEKTITAVAVNSCANQSDGEMVAAAINRVGATGIVTLEENKTGKTKLTFAEGLQVNCELASPYFCENPEKMETQFENAHLLITDQKIHSLKELLPMLEHAASEKLALVIIAEDFTPEVVAALVVNKVRGGLRVAALRCGYFADRREAVLGDVAALTGATLISKSTDLTPDIATPQHLGHCAKISMGMVNTKIMQSSTGSNAIANRVSLIISQIESAQDEYNKTRLSERLARLTGGVAVISVGAATELEQKEKKLRIEDAVNASRAAIEEGIVAGGGLAFLSSKEHLTQYIETMPEAYRTGALIVRDSLDAPIRQICENAGICADIVIDKIQKSKHKLGYDALNNRYTNMLKANIVDPAKVVKAIVRNAVSAASTLLTTEGIIVNNLIT